MQWQAVYLIMLKKDLFILEAQWEDGMCFMEKKDGYEIPVSPYLSCPVKL